MNPVQPARGEEVRRGLQVGQDGGQRAARDDLALAECMLGDARAVDVAPEFRCQFCHLLVAARVSREAGRRGRPRSEHRRAVRDQSLDPSQQRWGHQPVIVRQHEDTVTHAVGQREAAVLHAHAREERLGAALVVAVTGGHGGARG